MYSDIGISWRANSTLRLCLFLSGYPFWGCKVAHSISPRTLEELKEMKFEQLKFTDNCNKNEQKLEESYLTVLLQFELHRGIVNILQYKNHNIVRNRRNRNRSSRYFRHHSWPFRERSPPFLRQLENVWTVIESVPSKERKSQPSVKPGPRTGTFRTLISLPHPHRQSKILKF